MKAFPGRPTPAAPARRLLPSTSLIVLAGTLACAQTPWTPAEPRILSEPADVEAFLAAAVDEDRAVQRVHELVALGPRMGGTESGHRAAEYRAEVLRRAGLAVRILEDDPIWNHAEAGWELEAHFADGTTLPLASAWPWGFSPSASGRAPLSLEATAGSAYLMERARGAPREPLALALTDGANTEDGRFPVVRHLRPGDQNAYPVFGLGSAEAGLLRARLEAGEAVELAYSLETEIRRSAPRTVEARLAGAAGAPSGYLLYCAHGDSDAGGPGANDNASGEAIVLEIASAWAEGVRSGALPPPPRELRFVIWGSEISSTRDYLERHLDDGGPCLGVINFDQAGFGLGADQLNIEPDDLPANEGLVRTLAGLLEERAGEEGFPERWATNKSLGGTDSYVFSGSQRFREAGVPALTVFISAWNTPEEHERTPGMPGESWSERELVYVDYDPYYHSAGDTPENTTDSEPWNMAWCARVALLGGLRWLEVLEAGP